ncbi:bifunctional polysaccharide deacetylase/glycosyltransferase family 2 protein [Actinomadura sp. SCN-SB]|uniref:bifunctional polysaccharide deacetylase/glycosyltransferase family 2 protein n=1 Tax=Actinomadura sp. SCN-SB TaxID=3373092 RepID=UPI00374FF861
MTARTRGPLRPRWFLIVLTALAFACVLFVNGLINAQFGADGRAGPPGPKRNVPQEVREGGPIISGDPAAGRLRVPDRTVILTFDDGPDPTWTPKILDILDRHDVAATFFVVGSAVAKNPAITERIRRSGHELGLHTFTHADLSTTPGWRFEMELSQTQLAIAGAAGVTSSLFRPPYSSTADAVDDAEWRVLRRLGRSGYTTVLTTVDSQDWRRPGVERIVAGSTPAGDRGEIVLMHDGGGDRSQTVAALDRLIPLLRAKGYRFATVAQALELRTATATPPAGRGDRDRGLVMIVAVGVAERVVTALAWLLVAAGVLMVLRLALMFAVAGHHVRSRRPGRWSWGREVTEPVSVLVPAHNEEVCIADTLRSLAASDHPVEVIVVDDGSTDRTAEVVEGLRLPGVRLIRKENGGKPSALNEGLAAARHDLVVMMDGDTVFARDTVRRLVQPFADPRVGAVAGNAKIANRRALLGRWQSIEYTIGFNIDRRVYDLWRCMPTVPGAVGAFRRAAVERVGGVSDDTLAEDTDLTMALTRAGWWVVCEPAALAWTEAPATIGQLWRQRYRWSYGTMQAMWKHRRAVLDRGPSGRFGRLGLAHLALFQVALPVLAPLVDIMLVYGVLFLDPVVTVAAWLAVLAVQATGAVFAFRLDREPLRRLWALPVQQFVYRQLMYAVVIQSMVSAVGGIRLGWHKLQRAGGLETLVNKR